MNKDYYFPHDYNASQDEKIIKLLKEMGWEGYGLFWGITERIHKEGGELSQDYESIAFDMRTQCALIKRVIEEYKLFECNNNRITSKRISHNLKVILSKRDKARKSAQIRWNKRDTNNANAMRTQCERNAIKESKVKESKVKESNTIDFFSSIKTNPAYKDIDIDRELSKMDAWLLTRPGRKKTKRFIVNWLNKIDKPVITPKKIIESKRPEPINPEEHRKVSQLIRETVEKMNKEVATADDNHTKRIRND